MNTIADIVHVVSQKPSADKALDSRQRVAGDPHAGLIDSVEISSGATNLTKIEDVLNARAERIAQVRREIAGNTYETDKKIDATVDRIFAKLNSLDLHA